MLVVKMKLVVNNEVRYSNLQLKPILSAKRWEFAGLTETEDAKQTPGAKETLVYRLDEYRLPPILTRNLKGMDINQAIELDTSRVDKFVMYLPDEVFTPDLMKDSKDVKLYVYLVKMNMVSRFLWRKSVAGSAEQTEGRGEAGTTVALQGDRDQAV